MTFKSAFAISIASFALTACVSANGTDGSIASRYPTLTTLGEAIYTGDVIVSEASDAQLSGDATFSGAVAAVLDDTDDTRAYGDLQLTANFSDGTISGKADNFDIYAYAPKGDEIDGTYYYAQDLAGSLDIDGTITNDTLTADMDGVLTDDEDYAIDATMNGTFADVDGSLVAVGTIEGSYGGYELSEDGGFFLATED